MHSFRAKEISDASYNDMQRNISTHPKLKHIHACATQGSAFFLYKGGSHKVLSVMPGGETHVVHLKHTNPLIQFHTEPGVVYIFGYTQL